MTKEDKAEYMRNWRARQTPEWWDNNRKYMKKYNEEPAHQQISKEYKADWYKKNLDKVRASAARRFLRLLTDPVEAARVREVQRKWKRANIRGISEEEWQLTALCILIARFHLSQIISYQLAGVVPEASTT